MNPAGEVERLLVLIHAGDHIAGELTASDVVLGKSRSEAGET